MHAFNQNVLRAIWLNKLRAEIVSGTEDALLWWNALCRHFDQFLAIGRLILSRTGTRRPRRSPIPPVIFVGVTVDLSLTRDRQILLLEGIDEGRVVHALGAFPAREDQRILRRIGSEAQRSAFADVKIHVTLQFDRSGDELATRNHN